MTLIPMVRKLISPYYYICGEQNNAKAYWNTKCLITITLSQNPQPSSSKQILLSKYFSQNPLIGILLLFLYYWMKLDVCNLTLILLQMKET